MNASSLPVISLLTIFGFLVLIVSIVLAFSRAGKRLLEPPQVISAFGVNLQVSLLSLLILIGFLMSFSSFYLLIRNYDQEIKKAQAETETVNKHLNELQGALASALKKDVTLFVKLDGGNSNDPPKFENIVCRYTTNETLDAPPVNALLNRGLTDENFRVTLANIGSNTVIMHLELFEQGGERRKWVNKDIFTPVTPTVTLNMENSH